MQGPHVHANGVLNAPTRAGRKSLDSGRRSRRAALLLACAGLMGISAATALANDRRMIIQWFETSWKNIERRTPDLFMTGYNGTWLPPVSKASFGSPGYDPFDRFDLGSPGAETIYGTEQSFQQMVRELHLANVEVYPDTIMNHNGGRTSDANFLAAGGWPGFYVPGSGADFWGDFHDGTTQSIDPGGPNYNLFEGDLVGLIDIAQEKNYSFIRHPVAANPQNIPPGTQRNRPDPNNRRFYPDTSLTPLVFNNPGPTGDGASWTIYPFNTANPLSPTATPVAENATGLLMRWTRWMIEVQGVDGFRLDAAKHIPQWFWNNYYDPAVYQRRVGPSGARTNPFSFGESVAGNSFVQTYIRNKDGFGNRDALDLNEAGGLRDLLNARGFGRWGKDSPSDPEGPLERSIDTTDDGFNNGSQGVHHFVSHDNGTTGSGSSAPGVPSAFQQGLPQNAYVLFRSGIPIVYYNGREMHDRFSGRGFWPREGNPTALGNTDARLQRLVQIASAYVRADNTNIPSAPKTYFRVLNSTDPVNTSLADVLVIERTNWNPGTATTAIGVTAAANVIVGLNDRYDAESGSTRQLRSVQTSFAPGTRLVELSGTAADPVVNNAGAIPQVLTVDANRRVTITIPNNTNSAGVEHNRGYVVYGPIAPTGNLATLEIQGGGARTVPAQIAPDPVSVPAYARRLTPIDVITTPTFEIRLDTTKADPLDPNWDDFAVFRINQGFRDFNGNGNFDQPASLQLDGGFERFLTQFSPIAGPGGTGNVGVYRQVIDTSLLSEGVNYLSVICYRRRTDGGAPIFTNFRRVFYVDRAPPSVALQDLTPNGSGFTLTLQSTSSQLRVLAADRTTQSVWVLVNVPVGTDPLTLINPSNQASQHDRLEWRRNPGSIPAGNSNSITVVAQELSGRFGVVRYDNVSVALGSGDVNIDGFVDINDLYSSWQLGAYTNEADLNRDGFLTSADRFLLEQFLRPVEAVRMEGLQR